MTAVVTERPLSHANRSGPGGFSQRVYNVTNTNDGPTARAAVMAEAPATWDGRTLVEVDVEPTGVDSWIATVTYRSSLVFAPPIPDDVFESFTTRGATVNLKQSLAQVGKYPASAEDSLGAIGATGDTVEGVDIVVPQFEFQLRVIKEADDVDLAYKVLLADMTGRVNDDIFRGFPAGTLLFLGADGTERTLDSGADGWEIIYAFAFSRNRTDFSVGGITIASKKGWEAIDVRYKREDFTTRSLIVPDMVYVHRVYPDGDFDLLEIPS